MEQKRVAILQSNYIPWKGYFDLINSVHEFVLLDDVQYTRRDWRNRNKIKTAQGTRWLTIPVEVSGRFFQTIDRTRVSDPLWHEKHLETVRCYYKRAKFFRQYEWIFADLHSRCKSAYLSEINRSFIEAICGILQIPTKISSSSDYESTGEKTERLIGLCKRTKALHYLSGPSAKAYLDESLFAQEGITVSYMDYSGYPEYPQLFPPFIHAVSILDLLFNVGPEAPKYMKSF